MPLSTHERKLNRTPRSTFPQSPMIKSSSGVKIQSSKKKTVGEIAKKDARKLVAVLIRCFFFRTSHAYHLNILLEQLLKDAGLSVDWKDTILPLVMRISEQVTKRKGSEHLISPYIIAPESRI